MDVQGAVEQRAAEIDLVGVGRFGVVDRDHDVALGGQVLGQVGHQDARARIAVRDDDQGIGAVARVRRGTARGAAGEFEGRDRPVGIAGPTAQRVVVGGHLALAWMQRCRVRDLERQRPVVKRVGVIRGVAQDVDLVRVDGLEGAHSDGVRAAIGQFRRIGARVAIEETALVQIVAPLAEALVVAGLTLVRGSTLMHGVRWPGSERPGRDGGENHRGGA
jgi:hypothetical protein